MNGQVAIHVSPHPDDELIGSPCTLFHLLDAGWRVLNIAASLGRPEHQLRRLAELEEACRRAGFDLEVLSPLASISSNDNLEVAENDLVEALTKVFRRERPRLVVAPSPSDAHHGHEVVGAAVLRSALASTPRPTVWQWGLWADLSEPNMFVPVSEAALKKAQWAVAAHTGEVDRNNYVDLLEARARMNAILGAERVFGWGADSQPEQHAEILRELVPVRNGMARTAAGRRLDPCNPLAR